MFAGLVLKAEEPSIANFSAETAVFECEKRECDARTVSNAVLYHRS